MSSPVDCDVLIIGGGPGGTSAATLLTRKGWRVLLLEKERHPRFHIGESLLPCNLPILEQLGVLDKVRALGVIKLGADFPSRDGSYQTFHFRRALGHSPPHAFQVKREEFDQMLFEHARDSGVDAREQVTVEETEVLGMDSVRATARDADGKTMAISARYLVDASGRDTFLGKRLKLKRKNDKHQSAAIFAHFLDVERRPGEDAGNISIYNFEHGWCWFIPLRDGVMSVGCVCWPEYLKQRKGDNEGFLLDTLKRMPEAFKRMQSARITDEVRVTGNYSYACSRMAGPGWIMAGDAWAFVDPVFSSGVYLAMHGGSQAADVVDAALREPSREASLQRKMARRVRRGVRVFSWFIYRFNSPIMRRLFAHPRNHLRVEEGVISMLAGDVFDSRAVMLRMYLFRLIYAATGLLSIRTWLLDRGQRRRQARAVFRGGTTPVDPA
jgi:flavin-dependent dehydrogenase